MEREGEIEGTLILTTIRHMSKVKNSFSLLGIVFGENTNQSSDT